MVPSCHLTLTWPRIYGDVYWRDNCLKDGAGNVIFKECCSDATQNTDTVDNPYYVAGLKKEDCQALLDDKNIFPDGSQGSFVTKQGEVGDKDYGTPPPVDNGKKWYKGIAFYGTCTLMIVGQPGQVGRNQ